MELLNRFLRDESGTATAEWVVLTAVTVGMAVASMNVIKEGAASASEDMNSELSATNNAYEVSVKTVYDEAFMEAARAVFAGYSLDEMKTLTGYMDDMTAELEAQTENLLSELEWQLLNDFDVAIDMAWYDMGLSRPSGMTWTETDVAALPGEFTVLAMTY